MKSEERKQLLPSRQLADLLREAIRSGELAPGARLPSERNLAEVHHVARNTAREAVRTLVDEGLVIVEHGRGAFVREKPKLMRFGASRYSKKLREQTGLSPYRAEVEAQGKIPSVECTSIVETLAPDFVTERLELPTNTPVIRRENHYFADAIPIQIGTTYIPTEIASGTVLATSKTLGTGSLYARFEDQGHIVKRIHEEISARMPTPEESIELAIPNGVPLLEIIHTSINQFQKPFEVTVFLMRSDLSGADYSMEVPQ